MRDERHTALTTCACGCGASPRSGNRYVRGHHGRKSPVEYIEEDRGYATPCWIWQGALSVDGYAITKVATKLRPAARVIYERERGPLPEGQQLARRCGVRACVHPDHGEPGRRGNALLHQATPSWRAHQAGVCQKGHLLTPDNTATLPSGKRVCKTCKWERQRAYYQRTEAVERRVAREERRQAIERAATPPDHLEPGAPAPKLCTRGHVVAGANAKPDGHGAVTCRTCANAAVRRWKERQKAKAGDGVDRG